MLMKLCNHDDMTVNLYIVPDDAARKIKAKVKACGLGAPIEYVYAAENYDMALELYNALCATVESIHAERQKTA